MKPQNAAPKISPAVRHRARRTVTAEQERRHRNRRKPKAPEHRRVVGAQWIVGLLMLPLLFWILHNLAQVAQ